MEATELMIGDWVFNKHHKKYIQITPYDFFNHAHLPSGEKYFVSELKVISGRDFEPIPLTPEILERNGFTHCVTSPCGYYHAPACDMFDVLFHASEDTYEDTWHTEVFTDHNDNNFVLFNLCYVHELQHTLRLCGLNALADNLKMEE